MIQGTHYEGLKKSHCREVGASSDGGGSCVRMRKQKQWVQMIFFQGSGLGEKIAGEWAGIKEVVCF